MDRNKVLRTLEKLEVDAHDTEKDVKVDIINCKPSKLFNLISQASMYRGMSGFAEEEFPEDPEIKEHVKSSKNLLTDKTLKYTSKFEEDCLCTKRERIP